MGSSVEKAIGSHVQENGKILNMVETLQTKMDSLANWETALQTNTNFLDKILQSIKGTSHQTSKIIMLQNLNVINA